MAALVADSCLSVDHGSSHGSKMADSGASTSVSDDISKLAKVPMDPKDPKSHTCQGDTEPTTETSVMQPENQPMKPNGGRTNETSDSPSAAEPPTVEDPISEKNELASKEAHNDDADKDSEPSSRPSEDGQANNLYRQYLEMIRRISAGDTGESLLTGVVDYMKVVDERLRTVEEKLRSNEESKTTSVTGGESPPNESRSDNPNDIRNEVKFFEAGEEDINSDGNLRDMAADHGRFSSTHDHPQVLRVLYNKFSDNTTFDKVNPEPGQIDITYINILSDPIASFFRDVLALDCGQGSACIRLSKPFRPLIRNIKPLRDHLAKLQKAYGYLQLDQELGKAKPDADDSTKPTETDAVVTAEMTEPNSTSTVPPVGDASEHHEKPFLRPSALPHFSTIVRFVDQYLYKSLGLYEKLKSGDEDKVAFENLWMLFDARTTIYCPYRSGTEIFTTTDAPSYASESDIQFSITESRARYSPQAYRVLSTRGGIPLKTSLMPGGIEEDFEETDFLQNVDALLRLDLFRHGDPGGHRKDIAQPLLRHGVGGAATRRNKNATSALVISCFDVEYDGDRFGTQRELFKIKPYSGLKDIRDMEVFPAQYAKDEEMDRLLQRGRRFVDLTNNAHMSYEGNTAGRTREMINSEVIVDFKTAFDTHLPDILEMRPDFSTRTNSHWPRTTEGGQREVHDWYEHDPVEGQRAIAHRWCFLTACQKPTYYAYQDAQSQKVLQQFASSFESHSTQQAKSKKAREEFRLHLENNGLMSLFPGAVPGYALRNRKWVQLDMDQLQDVQHGDDWNNLVLPKGHRKMVQAMVESYTRRSDSSQATDQASEKVDLDLVRGKGKGCIILLHGAPGVGKTSTAECVAAYTKRPLYPITCGDIGHLPDVVEANLEKHFELAHRWACVLLLDEADVFLAKRTKTDVKRNGLVSVFLRILEYYPGILFLTTNRVGAIDDAFRSRLHLTLYYPKLLKKQSIKIWENNVGKLKEVNEQRVKGGQQPIKYDKREIIEWASTNWKSLQWNGRQIRNAFQTAIALAEFQAHPRKSRKQTSGDTSSPSPKKSKSPVLDQDTFMLIADASNQFNEYLLQTHGQDEEMTASRDQVRTASFKAQPTPIKRVRASLESSSDSDAISLSSQRPDSHGLDSDVETDASGDSELFESDSETDKKRKKTKAKKSKSKSEKKTKEKESSDEEEKKKKKTKKKKKSDL